MLRWWTCVSLLGSACLAIAAAVSDATPKVVPGAYLVELADDHDSSSFYDKLGSIDVNVKPRMDLKYSLFKGASFQLRNTSNEDAAVKTILDLPEVKKIWPVRVYHVPNDKVIWKGDDRAAMESSLSKRQLANDSDTYSPHVMTQVDKLRAKGITGAGLKIGIVDTGVDYNHPALGGGFGPGHLVSYGTDLVGDAYTGFNVPVPDPDPLDECEGHGTHVSGIIAAQANSFGFTGAAPGVTLGMFRVFGCSGSAGNDVLIAAFNEAFEAGSDIITASVGGSSGWTEDAWAVAVQRIVEAGVPCTLSAGNDGNYGLFYASSAADGKRVAAVASVDNTQSPMLLLNATYDVTNGSEQAFGWTQGTPAAWGNISLPLWAVSYNTSDPANGCNPFPDNTPDLGGYIVLIRRGTCMFVQKVTNAAAKGAKYVLFYNNAPGLLAVSTPGLGVAGIGMVTADQGATWIAQLASGNQVTLNIVDPISAQQYSESTPNTLTGGYLSTYTSWGPTWEADFKPQFSAPGGSILSTYPLALGAYAVLSGTSMACPLAASIYALVATVRGTKDPATLERLLAATAEPTYFNDGEMPYSVLAPTAQQGAGMLQAYDAAYSTTLLSVSSISFNDTDHFVTSTNFTIENTGTEANTYSLSNVLTAGGYTLDPGSIFASAFPNQQFAQGASLAFSSDSVTVPAGGVVTVTVTPTAPTGLDASRLPVYGGYIALNATNGESLSIPYLGVAGSLHDATVLDKNSTYLTQSADPNAAPVPANQTFVLSQGAAANDSTNYPVLALDLALGSATVRADVVPQDPYANTTTVVGVKTIGNVAGFPALWDSRGPTLAAWNGTLETGEYVPAGAYSIVVRALKIFGDSTKAEDWEMAQTVGFAISYS